MGLRPCLSRAGRGPWARGGDGSRPAFAWPQRRLATRPASRHLVGARNRAEIRMSDPFAPPVHRTLAQRLRSWFFTGLVVFGPIAATAYIAWWVIDTIDNWVRPWLPRNLWPDDYLPFHVPGFGVVIAHCRAHPARVPHRQFRRPFAGQVRRGDARPHAARSRRLQGPEAGVRDHLQPVRQPVPQGRAGRVSGQGELVDRLHLLGAVRDHCQARCRERGR